MQHGELSNGVASWIGVQPEVFTPNQALLEAGRYHRESQHRAAGSRLDTCASGAAAADSAAAAAAAAAVVTPLAGLHVGADIINAAAAP